MKIRADVKPVGLESPRAHQRRLRGDPHVARSLEARTARIWLRWMHMRLFVAVASLLLACCSIDRQGFAIDDTARDASPARDARSEPTRPPSIGDAAADRGDALRDAAPGPIEPPDTGPVEPPDTGPVVPPGPLSCAERYGDALAFHLCAETAAQCTFFVRLEGSTCDAACAGLGGACLGAYNDGGAEGICESRGDSSCSSSGSDHVCTCTRPG